MSSFLCFICHSTVNSDTNEDIREKYREVIGMNLCPDSHLCHICCHMLNKLWLFKSICLKRSLEYPVLFSEKGAINLQRNDIEHHVLCSNDACHGQSKLFHYTSQHINIDENNEAQNIYDDNEYVELHDDRNDFEDYFHSVLKNDFANKVSDHGNDNARDDSINDYENNVPNNDYDNEFDEDNANDSAENNEFNDFATDITACDNNHEENDSKGEISELDTNADLERVEKDSERVIEKKSKRHKKSFKKNSLSLEEQKAELERRRRQKEYTDAEFKCYNCALGFLFNDTYQTHMMRHEESNGEFRCEICTLRFASQAVLRAHRAVHARGTNVKRVRKVAERNTPCHLCGRVFSDASGLQQHLRRFHRSKTSNRTYPCSVCGRVYNDQAAVRTHLIKHINRKFTCDQCQSTFSSPYTLNQHKKRHEIGWTPPQHYCEICKIAYSTRKSLLAHKRNALVHQQAVFECPICNRTCPNQRSLSSHIATVHSATKDFHCTLCKARYTSRKSLVRHMGSHNKKQIKDIHICHQCPSTFKSRSKLNRHLREVCGKDKLDEELSVYYQE